MVLDKKKTVSLTKRKNYFWNMSVLAKRADRCM